MIKNTNDILRKLDPREFELFMVKVFEEFGMIARETPASRDGGYDIYLEKGGRSYAVECKRYGVGSKIGRPMLQRLIGAKQSLPVDGTVFVTTSSYTKDALNYGNEQNMILIDGSGLDNMIKSYNELCY